MALVGYFIWSFICFFVGTRFMEGQAADVSEVMRPLGYASAPQALAIFSFIPCLGGLIALVGALWSLVAGIIAVREALDFDTGKAVVTVVVGWIVVFFLSLLVGAIFGILGGVSTGLGTLVGGWLADRLGPERPSAYALVPAFGVTLALPFYLLVFTRETWQAAAWLLFLPGVFHFFYVGPTFGMVQNSMPGPMRATAAAVLLFVVNIFGLGLGPPLCGWMIDAFSASSFGAREVGEFVSRCPGGIGAAAGGPELDALCRGAVAHGTRRGILSMHVFFAWGALHYFASAFALRRRKPASPTVGVPPRRPRDDE